MSIIRLVLGIRAYHNRNFEKRNVCVPSANPRLKNRQRSATTLLQSRVMLILELLAGYQISILDRASTDHDGLSVKLHCKKEGLF